MFKYLIISLFLFCPFAVASEYAIQRDDGKVVILNYIDGSNDTLEDVIAVRGLQGKPIIEVKEKPAQADRKYWKIQGGKLVVDIVKKQNDEAAEIIQAQAKKEAKDAVLAKLKITDEELQKVLAK